MKYYFITNPAAGKSDSTEEICSLIKNVCDTRGIEYVIYKTTGVGDATRYVKETCLREGGTQELRFFACGGDGTFSEVVSGAVGQNKVSVGLIPKGSGNDFVRNFSNSSLFFDISAQLDGESAEIDILKCNDKYAVNMINIGFDCEVVKKMVQIKRSPLVPAGLAYIFGLVITLVRKPGVKADISLDGKEFVPHELLLTTIANGCYCGGGFHSNPHALLSNGKLNALLVKNISRLKFISIVGSYKSGTHICKKNEKLLDSGDFNTIDLRFPSMQSISIDGELNEIDKELHIEVMKGALSFVIPKGSAFLKEENNTKYTKEAAI